MITVDTSIAHLAGAMGKPVWILLPFDPDWRWLLGRKDSPWYPTARLFRQTAPHNWTAAIAEAASELGKFLQGDGRVLGPERWRGAEPVGLDVTGLSYSIQRIATCAALKPERTAPSIVEGRPVAVHSPASAIFFQPV